MKQLMTYVLLFYGAIALKAQDTHMLRIEQIFVAIDSAYPQLQLYESKIAAIRSLATGAKSWMPPTFAIDLDRFPYKTSMIKEEGPDNQAGIMLSLQQMVPNPTKLNAKRKYLASLEDVQRNDLEWQKNTLHFTARLYYYRRYTAERKLKLLKENRDLLNMLIKTARDKYVYNQVDLSGIFKAEAALSELANMESMLFSQIAESNIGLNTLMDRDVNSPFCIDSLLTPKNYTRGITLESDSLQMPRSDISAIQTQIRSMEINRRWMAAGAKADFGIQFAHGQMFGMPNQFSIMGMVSIPVAPWSSKMYRSEVKSMEGEIQAMLKEKETMQLMATQMIREKFAMLFYQAQQLDNYEKSVLPAYRKNLESSLLAYKQNTGSFFILLDAWNMLLMKELERIEKLGGIFAAQSEYEYQREIK